MDALEKATADDNDFEADSDEIEDLQKKLGKSRDLLADQIVKGKKLEDAARTAVEKGRQDRKDRAPGVGRHDDAFRTPDVLARRRPEAAA